MDDKLRKERILRDDELIKDKFETFIIPEIKIFSRKRYDAYKDIIVKHVFGMHGIYSNYSEALGYRAPSLPTLLAMYISAHKMTMDGSSEAETFIKLLHHHNGPYGTYIITGTAQIDNTLFHHDDILTQHYSFTLPEEDINTSLVEAWEKYPDYCKNLTGQ